MEHVLIIHPGQHTIPPRHYSKIVVMPGATLPGGMLADVTVDTFIVQDDTDSPRKTRIGSPGKRLEMRISGNPDGSVVVMPKHDPIR